MLRWIDELNGVTDADTEARRIKCEIKETKKQPNSVQVRRRIRELYAELDNVQFKPDYMCLIIDKEKDYYRACRGFSINGVKYKRLLGTNGGIKNSTIVFVSERLWPELNRRVENDRNPGKELVTAKLEAYRALTCSASVPVSMPRGILVVNDAETEFLDDIIYISDEQDGEPVMEERSNTPISIDASDGFGLMLPSLAERWSSELGLDYTVSGANTRMSYEKGMVFTFDYIDFADKVAGSYTVRDAWGNEADIRNVELVLTTSMLKLWDSYESCDDYISKSVSNGYTFGIAKTCPRELENERCLNYQFIQGFSLTDEDIDELISASKNEFREVLHDDWRKSVLFLKGDGITEKSVVNMNNDFVKALMIDSRMSDDPFVRSSIYQLIKNRINEAKVGVIKVHGNYSIVSGDPFLLCQSMFGLEKTGLLRAGEIYNRYWADRDAERLVCFRAPMTCFNNVRGVVPVRRDDADYWFKYIRTATVFNGWDTAAMALNGMDFDGDLVMLTDNEVLLRRHKPLPALMCAQRKAEKRISTEDDFIRSNIESFGNDIGKTTNWITSMFEVQAGFDPESEEYKALAYRIMCGQLYQQNSIDKAKGIICKPMPKEWHDRHASNTIPDEKTRTFYRKIVADKKPYFMRYIYPDLMKQYNTYIKNTDRNAMREFGVSVSDLKHADPETLTVRQKDFLQYFEYRMPVGTRECVLNKICRKFEDEFDGYVRRNARTEFNCSFMKSSAEYTYKQYSSVKNLYESYNRRLMNYSIMSSYDGSGNDETDDALTMINEDFRRECDMICPDSDVLCNILIDICYLRSATKRFVWMMCGDQIIQNLLRNNEGIISFPEEDPAGDLVYCGKSYTIKTVKVVEEK